MNVLMVYPEFPDTFWSFKHALRFVNKKASSPPLGLITVAAMLPVDWDLKLVDMNINTIKAAQIAWADLVFISAMVVQRSSAMKIIQDLKSKGKKIVAGGPLFTSAYTDFIELVDHFVLNEAEITLPLFLDDLANGQAQKIYQTTEYCDITKTPTPRWDLVNIKHYDSLSIQFSRGCPFNCDFCNVTVLLGHRPRLKTSAQIIAELDTMYQLGWRRNIFFVDDNFIGNRHVLKNKILPALIEWQAGKTKLHFITESSINLSDDPELMNLMTKAGFKSVFVGIETPDENGLKECNKLQNNNRNLLDSVKRLQKAGLQVMGGFIVGFDSDNAGIFKRQIEFIQKSGIVTAMVGILQAPHGTLLYQRLTKEGRIKKEMSGDNADGSTNIIPKMNIDDLKKGYLEVIKEIYSPHLFYERVKTFLRIYDPVAEVVALRTEEIGAFFKSIWRLGIVGKERREYWQLFFWTLKNHPKKFPLAITFSIYGYHFRKICELQQKEQSAIS